jgi:hypothetical protein
MDFGGTEILVSASISFCIVCFLLPIILDVAELKLRLCLVFEVNNPS